MAVQEQLQSELLTECLAPHLRARHGNQFFIGRMLPIEWRFEPQSEFITPTWFFVAGVPELLDGQSRQFYGRWRELPVRLLIDVRQGTGDGNHDNIPWSGRKWIIERQLWPGHDAQVSLTEGMAELFRAEGNDYLPERPNSAGRLPIAHLGIELGFWEGKYRSTEGRWFRVWDAATGVLFPVLEEQWTQQQDPEKLLASVLERRQSDRKLRLFATACNRRYAPLRREEKTESEAVTDVAERFADGLATAEELASCHRSRCQSGAFWSVAGWYAPRAAYLYTHPNDGTGSPAEKAALLRDLFGHLVLPSSFDPAWFTPAVVSLAQAAYEDRLMPSHDLDPVRLAILADALEEAGCTNNDVLAHLRSPGPHVRGCWPLDLCLGKE